VGRLIFVSCLSVKKMQTRALVKNKGIIALDTNWNIDQCGNDEVLIQVAIAGICKTDIRVAKGVIHCVEPCVLGHEFSGRIVQKGASVASLALGNRVAVMPMIGCGACCVCQSGFSYRCPLVTMLGVDRNGCFSEYIKVPARSVYVIPESISFQIAAYIEPLAAALAILQNVDYKNKKIKIIGTGRIAELTRRVLAMNEIEVGEGVGKYDIVVDAQGGQDSFNQAIELLSPGGMLIIKNRSIEPLSINPINLLHREITIRAAAYAPFQDAINVIRDNKIQVNDLFGTIWSLEEWQAAFNCEEQNEDKKHFFAISSEAYH